MIIILFFFLLFSFLSREISDEGINFLIEREGFDINHYKDTANVNTIVRVYNCY